MYVPMNFEPAALFSEEERVLELKVAGGVEWAGTEEESTKKKILVPFVEQFWEWCEYVMAFPW